ncbi:MAG: ABC transporter permease [Nitriliruptorales bacterium]|nr:ABC transporter permease [Nitriliruptorales bacterium]
MTPITTARRASRRADLRATLRVIRWAARAGWEDRKALFTWRSWTFGWFLRLVTQVLFFALIGVLLGSEEQVHWLFVGNVVAIAALGTLAVGPDASEERYYGTLPLLVAAPSSPIPVLTGKTLLWMAEAFVTSVLAFVLLAPPLGHPLVFPDQLVLLPVLATVVFANYALGIFMASLVFRAVHLGNTVFNFVFWLMAAICGVNVAVEFFPAAIERLAYVLPLTHGLRAIRGALGQADYAIWAEAGAELLVGAAWLALALMGFAWLAEGGRRDGTLDHAPG